MDPIPICYCFGFTRQDIWEEIRSTGKSTVAKRITAEVEAGRCAYEIKNPSGKCCLGDVTRTAKDRLVQKRESKLCDLTMELAIAHPPPTSICSLLLH